MKSQSKHVRLVGIIFKFMSLWLFVALWWGLITLAPMQIHNQLVKHDLLYICLGFLIFLFIGFWRRSKSLSESTLQQNALGQEVGFGKTNFFGTFGRFFGRCSSEKVWIIPLVLIIGLDILTIFYFNFITLSFLLTAFCILLVGLIIDLEWFCEMGCFLFLSSLGFGMTKLVMNFFQGRPEKGIHFFAYQISGLLNLFGKNSEVVSGAILFQGKKVTCDLVKLGFYPWLAFTLTFLAVIILAKCSYKRKFIALFFAFFIHYFYLLVRFSIIAGILPKIMLAGFAPFNLLYWRVLLISFMPLVPLWLILFYEFNLIEVNITVPQLYPITSAKNDIWLWASLVMIVLFLTASFSFYGFTTHRKIHCLIDEIHSDWESSLIDFNEHIYGTLAENSYHSFLDYLRHFYQVTILTDKISMAPLLNGVEISYTKAIDSAILNQLQDQYIDTQAVLILKCITTPFTQKEIEVIKDFVFKGGSVFLIGDHTDVFFMNKHLNELSQDFGIRFEQNSVYFVDGGWIISDPPHLRNHPSTRYIKNFIWATGDSLTVHPPAFPLICSPIVSFADQVNYFYDNFFGNTKIDAEEIFGSYCLMAGAKYGKGRVVAFTDSTCFNNYLMFTVGRRELIAGVFGWLGDKGSFNPFLWLTLIALCFFLVLLFKKRLDFKIFLYQLIIAVGIGWTLGYLLCFTLNRFLYPKPKSIRPLPPKVILEASHGPRHCLSFGNSERFLAPTSYDNLLYNIGRVDIFPEVLYDSCLTKKILDKASCLVIASPTKNFCQKEKNTVEYYIANGGSLLLIEGANPNSTINQIANLFDINSA